MTGITRKHKYAKLTRRVLPKLTKQQITKKLYPITKTEIIKDFEDLKNESCDDLILKSRKGVKFVDFFTAYERLNTKGRRQISFFDFYLHFNEYYNDKYYLRNGLNSVFKGNFFKDKEHMVRNLKSFYNLYLGNVSVFRPVLAKQLICKFKPKTILDFTMGWGGRLVAACSENIDGYIGVDLNTNLKPQYDKMVKLLKTLSTTKIQLFFKDAVTVDYSKLDYDCVFTSPPYYNVEIYNNPSDTGTQTIKEWNTNFYFPIFEMTFRHLKKNGKYCLNIPTVLYDNVAIKVLGKCDEKYPLAKRPRPGKFEYDEYVYVWNK